MIDSIASTAVAQRTEYGEFLRDVLEGLARRPKQIPCKYFYDRRGSQLFDAICELPEYYVTRTELGIMQRHSAEMAEAIGRDAMLIEFGSGSSVKTRLLLGELLQPAAYVPVDISGQHLADTAGQLREKFPNVEILPVCADFMREFKLPRPRRKADHRAVYFPGSTIGNFEPEHAARLLRKIAKLCGRGGGLLIGIDLQKDPATIEAAYNDAQGTTAKFNLNLLRRANRELAADFNLREFEHRAWYDQHHHRVDISLVSRSDQVVCIGDEPFRFRKGEAIHTEYSHKYTIDGFAEMASAQGVCLRRAWTDHREFFAVLHLVIAPRAAK